VCPVAWLGATEPVFARYREVGVDIKLQPVLVHVTLATRRTPAAETWVSFYLFKVDCQASYPNFNLSLSTAHSRRNPSHFLMRFERKEK